MAILGDMVSGGRKPSCGSIAPCMLYAWLPAQCRVTVGEVGGGWPHAAGLDSHGTHGSLALLSRLQ